MTERIPIPRAIEDLREVLGEAAMYRLLLAYPGMELSVPESVDPDHPLARAIGFEAACRLARFAAGARIYVSSSLARATRDRAICEARDAGDTVNEIAHRYGLTTRHVATILARQTP